MKPQGHFLKCPRCGGKTRIQVLENTELKNFPLFCPKCRFECLVNFKGGRTEI